MLAQSYLQSRLLKEIKSSKFEIDWIIKQYDLMVISVNKIAKVPGTEVYVKETVTCLKNMKKHIKWVIYKTKSLVWMYKDFIEMGD